MEEEMEEEEIIIQRRNVVRVCSNVYTVFN